MQRLSFVLLAFLFCFAPGIEGHAQTLRQQTIYIQNPTSGTINFSYRKGGDDWKKYQIKPGYTLTMTGIANHYVAYNNAKGKVQQYTLSTPQTLFFSWSQGMLQLKHR